MRGKANVSGNCYTAFSNHYWWDDDTGRFYAWLINFSTEGISTSHISMQISVMNTQQTFYSPRYWCAEWALTDSQAPEDDSQWNLIGEYTVPDVSVWGVGLQGLVLFALYCLGMVGALVVAWILKHTTGKGENRTLMLELPSYHLPRIDALAHGLWQRACIYLQKVGTIILALTVFLWVLTTFPGAPAGATDPAINYSFAGMLGRALEPLFAPIGFNWQMCISLVPAMGAREVAVSVLGTLYATASDAEDALVPILQHSWTIPMGLSFLAFFVFSPSCFATLAAIKREMGTWKAPAVLWVAYTLLAYAFSFVVYRTALWVCG